MAVHDTAVVHPDATLADDVDVGPLAVIGAGVRLAAGVSVGAHAVLEGDLSVGEGTRIHPHAALGGPPQDRDPSVRATSVRIGARCVIREFVTVHAGSAGGRGATTLGDEVYAMSGAHVASDCALGDRVTLANAVAVARGAEIGDDAVLGELAGVHPHVRVGRLALVGAGAMCAQDVPPFTLAQGDRARLFGLNIVGLRTARVSPEALRALKTAWRRVFTSGLAMRTGIWQARQAVSEGADDALASELLDFLEAAQRGVCRAASAGRR
jgi:UDP-N-acetylglucosamine acyltransferase